MESFCSLCAKSGIKKKLKAFQINLDEALWACESNECSWPIGYEELTFFHRRFTEMNNREEPKAKDDMSALMELSLYTPPVTPRGELSKESTEIADIEYLLNSPTEDGIRTSEMPMELELFKLESANSTEENIGIMNNQIVGINISKTPPRIVNVEKTNINLTILPSIDKHHNEKTQEHRPLLMDASIKDTFQNFDTFNSAYTRSDLNTQYKHSEQIESGKLQSHATASMETNIDAEKSSEMLVDLDVINSLDATNESIENIADINKVLNDILNDCPVPAGYDWLDNFFS